MREGEEADRKGSQEGRQAVRRTAFGSTQSGADDPPDRQLKKVVGRERGGEGGREVSQVCLSDCQLLLLLLRIFNLMGVSELWYFIE